MKKLSIIVPVYNIGQYLEECIESLIEQTYSDKEIILVDDGSTDNSGKICDAFAGNYSYIKVIHQENKGLPFARNAGLEIAEGEYIGFVDSDDVIKKDMYKKLISALEETDADMAVCNFEVFNKSGIRAVSDRYNTDWIQYSDKNAKQFYSYALDSSCNKIYKHEIIQRNNLLFMDKNTETEKHQLQRVELIRIYPLDVYGLLIWLMNI